MVGIRSRGMGGGQWTDHEDLDLSKPLTIICHEGNLQVDVTDAIEINFDYTRYHGNRVVKIDPVANAWIEYILGYQIERDLQPQDRPDSMAHVIGLCDLPIKLMQKAGQGLPIFIREPEVSLHPSQQRRVSDFLSAISQHTDNATGSFTELPRGYKNGWSV